MNYVLLLSQTPAAQPITVQGSGNLTDPVSWAKFFETVGFAGAVLVLVIAAFVVGVFWLGRYGVKSIFGPDGWVRAEVAENRKANEKFHEGFLGSLKEVTGVQDAMAKRCETCITLHRPGGSLDPSDLRNAAKTSLKAFATLAGEVGAKEAVEQFDAAREQIGAKD